jgi:hypothetical protein
VELPTIFFFPFLSDVAQHVARCTPKREREKKM